MKLLVIEDDQSHLATAKKFFAGQYDIEVVYSGTYSYAEGFLGKVDGVISDIYFPLSANPMWRQEEPIGVAIMVLCRERGIPCVLNTAGYHHGSKYEWITQLIRALRMPEIVDASDDDFKEANTKNWQGALDALRQQIAK